MDAANNETHQRILDTAEMLFSTRGYTSVRLRDIADAVGIKHAALYYYAPQGKEQLYVQVMERNLQRHKIGIEAAIREAGDDFRAQISAAARWLRSQPPMNLGRLGASDFRSISPENAEKLSAQIYSSMTEPLVTAIEQAKAQGIVTLSDSGLAAITFIIIVEAVHGDPAPYMVDKDGMIANLIDMMLNGWLKR